MAQKLNEPLRLYIFRYSKIHKSVTKRDACYDTDPSRWFRFLTSITNTTIADKITQSEFLPQNLQQCFEKALKALTHRTQCQFTMISLQICIMLG